ncbi:MAG TPA: thiamine ABC transporter substrate-binding protein [Microthrixaceae bacterium]|nr:thiamine ABC transporter substrate-binding protein [Microthrixaceae bacterium]
MIRNHRRSLIGVAVAITVALFASSCGEGVNLNASGKSGSGGPGDKVVLVTYDSFALPEEAAKQFEKETGARLEVLAGGDSSTVLTRALLSAGAPEGDVIFGIDNTIATRALSVDLLEEYSPRALNEVDPRFVLSGEAGRKLVPIDHGDVCLNFDRTYFAEKRIPEPTTLEQLADPLYRNLTVLESPVTSSPGLAFLIGTVAKFGESGWKSYWEKLKANGVKVRQSWDDAYYTDYTASGGDRPIVLSYASSPPVEVVYGEGKRSEPASKVMVESCASQVEYAGVLKGAKNPVLARKLLDFMLSADWQKSLPLSNFVYPVKDVELPEVFKKWSPVVSDPLSLDPAEIDRHRDEWIEAWRQIME